MYENIGKYLDLLIEKSTPERPYWNVESKKYGRDAHWNYIDGCMICAILRVGGITKNEKYFDFAEKFIDYYISDDGSILGYEKDKFILDDINEGRVLFELYERTKKEKYRLAIENLRGQLIAQPRTVTGNFWHKAIYENQIWLDGIYMAHVFSALYEKKLANADYSDILSQIKNVRKYMYDENKHLYYHGMDCSKKAFWADKNTGLSKNFWLRAMGWYLAALVDLIEICDGDAKHELEEIFSEAISGITEYADEKTGMYYQVIDSGDKAGNYLETSGSSMVAYAMLKGARLGVIDKKYALTGKKTFDGICEKYLKETENGLSLGGICLVAGLGPENNPRRDGTYEYYISEPIVENDAKGVAPFILCYTEIMEIEG